MKRLLEKHLIYIEFFIILFISLFLLILILHLAAKADPSGIANWFTAIGTVIMSIFTAIMAYTAWNVAKSWREEKIPDAKKKVIENLIKFDSTVNLLVIDINHTNIFLNYQTLLTSYKNLFNQLDIIESSLIYYYLFLSQKELELEKEQLDKTYLELKKSLEKFAMKISQYLNTGINYKSIQPDPQEVININIIWGMDKTLVIKGILNEMLNNSFQFLKKIAGEKCIIHPE